MYSGKRMLSVDVARGIAILCIIAGHLGNATINRVVFPFHVPLFYLVSGYFTSTRQDYFVFIKKRFRKLIIPYILTSIAMICIAIVLGYFEGGLPYAKKAVVQWGYASLYGSGDSYTKPFQIKAIGAIWFLWASFWGSIFLRFTLSLKESVRIAFLGLLIWFGMYSRKWFWFPLSIQAGCPAAFYMYLGYLIRQLNNKSVVIDHELKTALGWLAFLVWLFFIRDFKSFWLVHCDIGRGAVDVFGSLCACYTVYLLSAWIANNLKLLSAGLAYLGKYSIFMLCFHILELNLMPWWMVRLKLTDLGVTNSMIPYVQIAIKYMIIIIATLVASKSAKLKKLCLID